MIDFERFTHLTFDCYGTLIDWETGILRAVQPVLQRHGLMVLDTAVLQQYAKLEAELEAGPYIPYREVLRRVMAGLAVELGFVPEGDELDTLADSVQYWPPFRDSSDALQRLQRRYKLVILSNIDDDLFAASEKLLGVTFDAVITAQQVGSYKPNLRHFEAALARLAVPKGQILHVAQSLYHDHVPAQAQGFTSVWVNRPSLLPGTGLALPVDVLPDLEAPDMRTLVERMGL
ncbi:MAG: haloacid dehalogenase type II [Caldilineaceae bacterium]|nr:haloacid dehalogenase type II [Caldilineaceae bacterium]